MRKLGEPSHKPKVNPCIGLEVVLIEPSRLAQNSQGLPNFPSEVVFFSSHDSRLTLFQLVACVLAVIAREENNTFT